MSIRKPAFMAVVFCLLFIVPRVGSAAEVEIKAKNWGMTWASDFSGLTPLAENAGVPGLLLLEASRDLGAQSWRLVALDRESGRPKWVVEPKGLTRTGNILLHQGKLYVPLSDRSVVGLSPQNGEVLDRIELPERHAGLLRSCGANLCMMLADFRKNSMEAPRSLFLRALPRAVFEPELMVYDPAAKKVLKRHPFHRLETLPADFVISGNGIALIMPQGPIEIYDMASLNHAPLASYPLSRPEWTIDGERVVWLDGGQLFEVDFRKATEARPTALPSHPRQLLRLQHPRLLLSRAPDGPEELWTVNLNNGENARIGDFKAVSLFVRNEADLVALSDRHHAAFFQWVEDKPQLRTFTLPVLDDLGVRPIAAGKADFVIAVETKTGMQLMHFAELVLPPETPVSPPTPAFSAVLEPASRYRLLSLAQGEHFWESAVLLFAAQAQSQQAETATAAALTELRAPKLLKADLAAWLAARKAGLAVLAMGELAKGAAETELASLYTDLYHAARLKIGLSSPGAGDKAKAMVKDWPEGWGDKDLARLSGWCLARLSDIGYKHVAPIYRARLDSTDLSYLDQLAAFRVLLGHYDVERERLSRWFESRFRWEREKAPLARSLKQPDPASFVVYSESGGTSLGIFTLDFPVAHSLWVYLRKAKAKSGSIYFSGKALSQSLVDWLDKAGAAYLALPDDKRKKAKPPLELKAKGHMATISLFKEDGTRRFDVDLKDIASDVDKDGWTDVEESIIGLNNDKADSDDDGLPDGRDANPLLPDPAVKTNAQLIAQAVTFHDCQLGALNPHRAWLGDADLLRTQWVDFGGIAPVELPSCGQVNMIATPELETEVCTFVEPETGAPQKAIREGVIVYSEDGDEAWIGRRCGERKDAKAQSRTYHLRRLLKRWIVLDTAEGVRP